MASVESGAAAATANAGGDASIWGGQSQGRKFTKRHMIAAGAVAGAAILGLGLYFGLKGDSGSSDRTIITGQADVASEGCYPDANYAARTMTDMIRRDDMTTEMCNDHCADGGYFYYGVQWGSECWCGAEGIDLNKNGDDAVCDMACTGDDSQICGGYWAFTAYKVGTVATALAPSSSDCSGSTASVRFTSTTTYFEGGGCATLTDMYNAQGGETADGPLFVLDEDDNIVGGSPTGYWLIKLDVQVLDGVTLSVHGTSAGGDADVLRIWSTSSEFYELRGYGGNLSFKNTKVTSWDTDNGEERTDYEDGRSFINCVTQFDDSPDGESKYWDRSETWDCDGASNKDMGECRMDIIDSVMGNMGWFDAESYGLTWKVRGFCKDLSNVDIFDDHNVYGDITGSEIYGMYYGMYSYGHQGGVWTNNLMHDNILYGFDPHDDSDDLTISDNKVWNNGNHGIIASKRCNDVKIFNNEVWGGGEDAAGIFLHRSSDDAEVYNNYVHDMQDAGIALMESFDAHIYDNTFENCKYGIRLSLGCADNLIEDNLFDTHSLYGLYTYMGSDDPDVSGNNGEPKDNVFNSNTISNVDIGIHIKEGEDNKFTGNTFTSVSKFEFEDSSGTLWTGNDIGGACLDSSTSFASGSDAIPDCPDSDE